MYMEALNVVAKELAPLIVADAADADVDADGADDAGGANADASPPTPPDPALVKLISLCQLTSKSAMADMLVCGGCVDKAADDCLAGKCSCGFKGMWLPVRKTLVDAHNKLRDGVSALWQTKVAASSTRSAC